MTTVLIVDDHSIFRSGLRADLDDALEVLGEAATVDEAIALIAELRPEVVLLDDIPADRLGIRESIIGRMSRAGGSATMRPGVGGSGTEVHLHLEVPQ